MPARRPKSNRNSGRVLEGTILPSLKQAGFSCSSQVNIGQRHGGRKHVVDVVADNQKKKILVSLKWQQVSGTAEQKVPFEVICLLKALESKEYSRAYLVLGGPGWTLRDFFVNKGLEKYIRHRNVEIIGLEDFIAKANSGRL